jgi:hypothetical protein
LTQAPPRLTLECGRKVSYLTLDLLTLCLLCHLLPCDGALS